VDNEMLEDLTKTINKNIIRTSRIYRLEMALEAIRKECNANDGSKLDKAYNLVFQDLMAKLLELRNEDL